MTKKKRPLAGYAILIILVAFFIVMQVLVYIDGKDATYKACTVSSVELVSVSSDGAPSTFLRIQTEECGLLSISDVNIPEGMNRAGLAEFLQANIGKKFEFEVGSLSLGNNAYSSTGITSTTPIE